MCHVCLCVAKYVHYATHSVSGKIQLSQNYAHISLGIILFYTSSCSLFYIKYIYVITKQPHTHISSYSVLLFPNCGTRHTSEGGIAKIFYWVARNINDFRIRPTFFLHFYILVFIFPLFILLSFFFS